MEITESRNGKNGEPNKGLDTDNEMKPKNERAGGLLGMGKKPYKSLDIIGQAI